jgi:hypothetical protein
MPVVSVEVLSAFGSESVVVQAHPHEAPNAAIGLPDDSVSAAPSAAERSGPAGAVLMASWYVWGPYEAIFYYPKAMLDHAGQMPRGLGTPGRKVCVLPRGLGM